MGPVTARRALVGAREIARYIYCTGAQSCRGNSDIEGLKHSPMRVQWIVSSFAMYSEETVERAVSNIKF